MLAPAESGIDPEVIRSRYGDRGSEERVHLPGYHTILVVDDEAGILNGCARLLDAQGHVVLTASNPEAGLSFLRYQPQIDVALVDMDMPGMDILGFLTQTREIAPATACIILTEYTTLETVIESTKRGAHDVLTKPFTPDQLIRVINRALAGSFLMREQLQIQEQRNLRMLEVATEQSRLRTIIDCMADAVIVCNADRKVVLHNPAALRVLPHSAPDTCVVDLVDAIETPELLEMIEQASAQHERLSREIRVPNGGTDDWLLADVAPVKDEASGTFLGTVTVLRDITQIKQVEELKAQFVNMVAHELRAPLSAVSGYLSVMMEGMVKDPDKQRDMLQRSNERIHALLDLVSDLLQMSRMEAGTVQRTITSQQVKELITDVASLLQPLADEKHVTISVTAPDNLRRVEADREELIRLFTNLVSNAIKYNKDGGRVAVEATEEGPYVKVAVRDSGIGISPEGVERLFSEFFREKRPETAYVTGTGLGLSIVKRIVDFYHGRISADSELGRGSTFTVLLPWKYEAETPTSPAQEQP